jgi:serine/threonine-protein kinase RIO1
MSFDDSQALGTDPEARLRHPKIADGFTPIDVERVLIVEEATDSGTADATYGLLVSTQPNDSDPVEAHIELTKESDIYYVARAVLDVRTFEDFKQRQRLKKSSQLADFIGTTLKTTLTNVMTNRTTFKAVYSGRTLLFRQQLEFKAVKIFEIDFVQLAKDDPYVKAQAQFRYNRLQYAIRKQEGSLTQLITHIEQKDKSLAQQIKKSTKLAQTLK